MNRDRREVETAIVRGRIALLYKLDRRGKAAPLAHICLGRGCVAYGLRSDLPPAVASGLRAALEALSPLPDLARRAGADRIRACVKTIPMATKILSGPVYGFPDTLPPSPSAILVDQDNSKLFVATDPDLVGNLPFVQPCFAIAVDGGIMFCKEFYLTSDDKEYKI